MLVPVMPSAFIDPRSEAPALRRAALLFERVRQDAAANDPEMETLEAGLTAIRRAAMGGHRVHRSAVEGMQELARRIAARGSWRLSITVEDLLRRNALAEVRALLRRLAFSSPHRGSPAPARSRFRPPAR